MASFQSQIAFINDTIAHMVAWAGNSGTPATSGISYVLGTALGAGVLTKMADTYTAQWATALSVGAAALPNGQTVSGLNGTAFPAGVAPLPRAALASTNFMGVWQQGIYAVGNVVIWTPASSPSIGETGLTYICISPTTNTVGEIPSNTTYWSPYYMEIWEFTPGAGSLTPFYMKIEYGCSATAVADPMATVQFGTGYSVGASGYLTGNVTSTEYLFGTGVGATVGECDFASDGSNYLAMNLSRGIASVTSGPAILCVERSISGTTASAPVYNSNYITYVRGYAAVTNWAQQSLFLSGTPAVAVRVLYGNAPTLGGATASLIVNNTTPALPVFPLVGYCGNPMTALIVQQEADTTEGATQSCTVYGATHSYIMTVTAFAKGILGLGQATMAGVGVRFD
jgi:hypothetical protein